MTGYYTYLLYYSLLYVVFTTVLLHYRVPLSSLFHNNKMLGESGSLPNVPSPIFLGVSPTKLDTSTSSFRDKVLHHTISLIDDDSNIIYGILQVNGMYTLLDILSMTFQDIEDIECRVNNKLQSVNMDATNRLKILKSFSIHNERMKTPIRMNDWHNVTIDQFTDFRVSY